MEEREREEREREERCSAWLLLLWVVAPRQPPPATTKNCFPSVAATRDGKPRARERALEEGRKGGAQVCPCQTEEEMTDQ